MKYSRHVPPALAKNNFVRAQASDTAVLELVANLGFAEPHEVARVFSPYDLSWEESVRAQQLAYLVWLQEPALKQALIARANAAIAAAIADDASSFTFLQDVLNRLNKITKTEENQLANLRNKAPRQLRQPRVEPGTGLPLRFAQVVLASPAQEHRQQTAAAWGPWLNQGVANWTWQKCRTLAVKKQDHSSLTLAQRRLVRLCEAGLLSQKTTGTNTRLYGLTTAGARYLGDHYVPSTGRSSLKNLHKTLAKGLLLTELSTHFEGWSESAFYSNKHPGVLGTPGYLTHKDLFGTRPELKLHPPDAVLLRPLSQDSGVSSRLAIRQHTLKDLARDPSVCAIGMTLVEAERGNKTVDEFVKSLYPLINGDNRDGHVRKAYAEVLGRGPQWERLLEASRHEGASPTEVAFVPTKLVFAVESEAFLRPILAATWQFVSGKKAHVLLPSSEVGTQKYAATGLLHSLLDDTPNAKELVLWQELLSFIEVAYCGVSVSGSTFLGVSARFKLSELAQLYQDQDEA